MDAAARAGGERATEAPAAQTVVEIDGTAVRVTPLAEASARSRSRYERFAKPVIDWLGGLVLLVVTAPLMLLIAIAIRATMGGPVILRQERVGKHGEVFTLYKFRTMEPDRRSNDVPFIGEDRRRTHKHPHDPRITDVGRFLRVWSLDELPQFLNVLKGEMSLVGPRPEMVGIVASYAEWQHRRHAVKPGITGLWQISERGDKALHECTESDLEYLGQVSAWTDLRILALTPLAALGVRRGS